MKGDIEIRVNLTDEGAKNDLILDWRTTQFANDKDKPFADVVEVNERSSTILPNGIFDYQTTRNISSFSQRIFENGRKCYQNQFRIADQNVGRGGDALC